jgi:hypothetical protein
MDITSPQVWIGWIIAGLAAYLGVYLAEKAKRRAAHEDSDQIRDELARNTQAVKEIEAKISSDLWMRQWRLNQTRDAYVGLLRALSGLLGAHADRVKMLKGGIAVPTLEPMHEALKPLDEARVIASIFCNDAAIDQIEKLFRSATLDEYCDTVRRPRHGYCRGSKTPWLRTQPAKRSLGVARPR